MFPSNPAFDPLIQRNKVCGKILGLVKNNGKNKNSLKIYASAFPE